MSAAPRLWSHSALVAIAALVQNSKRMERIEKQLDLIHADLKDFYRTLAATHA